MLNAGDRVRYIGERVEFKDKTGVVDTWWSEISVTVKWDHDSTVTESVWETSLERLI